MTFIHQDHQVWIAEGAAHLHNSATAVAGGCECCAKRQGTRDGGSWHSTQCTQRMALRSAGVRVERHCQGARHADRMLQGAAAAALARCVACADTLPPSWSACTAWYRRIISWAPSLS